MIGICFVLYILTLVVFEVTDPVIAVAVAAPWMIAATVLRPRHDD